MAMIRLVKFTYLYIIKLADMRHTLMTQRLNPVQRCRGIKHSDLRVFVQKVMAAMSRHGSRWDNVILVHLTKTCHRTE